MDVQTDISTSGLGQSPLLATKLYVPPVRPELVLRPRLVKCLNAGLQRKLTLISAPAGFGKTTLLSEWIHCGNGTSPPLPVAWVSLDSSDNDPACFWTYLVAALQRAQVGIGEAALPALQSRRPLPIESILTVLINEIAGSPIPVLLILDDYHVINAQPIQDGMTFLLDHLPSQAHLVIASRVDPPLPLARLRGRGQLAELRAADLRFTREEVATFFNHVMGLDLLAQDVAALEARTEGWIVGLQMAALSMQGHGTERITNFVAAFTGNHRYVLDYLTEEVLHQQPDSVQTFLLQTAVLDRLSAPLCDAVTGQGNSREMLEQLDASNLFVIPLDDERRWYRYHHLFADLLRSRMECVQPDQVPVSHRRASEWYEENGFIAEAVGHALAAGDVDRVVCLVEGNALAMMERGEVATTTFLEWLDALPEAVVRARPWLCVAQAWALACAGQLDAVGPLVRDAQEALACSAGGDERPHPSYGGASQVAAGVPVLGLSERQRVAGHIAAIRAYVVSLQGEMSRAVELAREALEYLPEGDRVARCLAARILGAMLRISGDLVGAAQTTAQALAIAQSAGDSYLVVDVLCEVILLRFLQGQLDNAIVTCREALRLADGCARRGGRRLPIAGCVYVRMSRVLCERNELEAAAHCARVGVELCQQWGLAEELTDGYFYLAWILQALGDAEGALDAMQKAKQAAEGLSAWYAASVERYGAQIRLAWGDVAAAVRWARESGLNADDEISFGNVFWYRPFARVLIVQGRLDEALRLLARLLEMAEAAGAVDGVIRTLVLQSLALKKQGDLEQALGTLERALSLAEPEGYVRAFVSAGAPMGELLRQAVARGITGDYVGRLLAALEEETKDDRRRTSLSRSSSVFRPPPLIDPLSARELEVLLLLATGLSNKEIAQGLVIAVGTVKKHLKNVYGKLDVHSRVEAVTRAQALGLL